GYMAVRTECTFTLKIDCTASLISVLVAAVATWKTSVFWFSLMARPFSVITGRRRIWYADFIRPPPPLFHAAPGAAETEPPFSGLRPPLPCVAASRSKSSTKSATSQSPAERRLPGRSATDDKDGLHYCEPVRRPRGSANSVPGCDCRSGVLPPAGRCHPPSAR